jgi:hypothetical protein
LSDIFPVSEGGAPVELFLGIVVAIATVVGTVGSLILTHRGNQHFAEQNRIMIEQAGGAVPRGRIYKPPYWPLIAMMLMVILCWGAAVYDYTARNGDVANWDTSHLKRIEHQYYKNQTVTLDGKEFIDTTFDNVTFMYHGKEPTKLNGIHIVVKPGEIAGTLGSDNPVINETLNIVTAINQAAGCEARMTVAPEQ